MTTDKDLAARVRELLPAKGITEKKMFGGICFLLNGNMIMGASWRHLMVRVGKEAHDDAVRKRGVRPMEMKGRVFTGYVKVDPSVLTDDALLEAWVREAVDHGKALPAKAVKPGKLHKKGDDGLPLPPPLERARRAAANKKRR
jgi:TfoX/Sxy family transcriptional regulator of competence genes